jgi:hypothetical protein
MQRVDNSWDFVSANMSAARLVVCEKTSRWATSLRSVLRTADAKSHIPIAETRSLSQAEAAWLHSRSAALAIEVTATNLASAVELSARLSREPQACLLALADPDLIGAERLLREAGAVAVLQSTREAASAVRMIQRHLSRTLAAPATIAGPVDISKAIAARLPWPRQAGAFAQ